MPPFTICTSSHLQLTGPVIGEVTSGDAVVLLEVDRELHASSSSSGGLQRSGSAGGGFGFAYPAPFKGKIGVRGALYRVKILSIFFAINKDFKNSL